jgi:hypothetical protein
MQVHELDIGLYKTRVRMLGIWSRGRLRKVFMGPDDVKLDYWNMGTPVIMQINTDDNCGMETAPQSQE